MKVPSSVPALVEIISHLAKRRFAAAAASRHGRDPGPELPSKVLGESYRRIAEAFAGRGYRFAKSGPHFSRNDGVLTYKVSFHSSWKNKTGQLARVWIYGFVESLELRNWRAEQTLPLYDSSRVAGGIIHLLTNRYAILDWNLADWRTRDYKIAEVTATIERYVISYFEQFRDLPALCERLCTEDVLEFDIGCALEFLLCFADRESARRAGENFFKRHPRFVKEFRRELARFQAEGLPPAGDPPKKLLHPDFLGYSGRVAWVSVAYDLDIVV